MSSKRKCRLSPDSFCYICGYYIGSKQQKHKISPGTKLVTAYSAYFGILIGDQDKTWSPHVCCRSCQSMLKGWLRGEIKCMPFAIPRIWREPTTHLNDRYFCMVDVSHYRKSKDKRSIVYPNIPSSIAPVPHCEDSPIPEPPTLEPPSCASTSSEEDTDTDFCEASTIEEPHFPNQQEMDDLIQDMGLTKENTEFLTSRLKEWNLLHPTCKVSKYRKRHFSFARFLPFHNLIRCAISRTYLEFLMKLE